MKLELEGRTAVITGGSAGIGLACARALAAEGCRVAVIARPGERLRAALELLHAGGARQAIAVGADLASPQAVDGALAGVLAQMPAIDIWINSAGAIRAGSFTDVPDAQWVEDWNLKLHGYVRCARAVFPVMQRQGGGRIVNIIGAAARQVAPTYLAGGMANAALVNFTKGLSELGAPHRILVKAASPGPVASERWERIVRDEAAALRRPVEAVRAERIAALPLGRLVTPGEVADLACFLASPRSDMLNGATITIDGGASRGVYL